MDQPLKFKIMPKENHSEAFHSLNFVPWAWYSNATIDYFSLGLSGKLDAEIIENMPLSNVLYLHYLVKTYDAVLFSTRKKINPGIGLMFL